MSRLRRAAVVGAVLALVSFTVGAGPPPLELAVDPVIWLVYVLVALAGALAAVSVILAWQHVRESPRWLIGTLAGLLLLSVPIVWPFVQETRDTRRFLATADTVTGVVANKYVRGATHLVVEYEVAGRTHRVRTVGRNPFVGPPAFAEWARGDRIPVYLEPATPGVALVGHPGPDRRALIEDLVTLWIGCGVLLTAYLPLVARRLHRGVMAATPHLRQARQ